MTEIHQGNLRFVLLIFTYMMYLSLGAMILSALELPKELQRIKYFDEFKAEFLADKNNCLSTTEFEHLLSTVQAATKTGICISGNSSYCRPNWNFGGSMLYATTLLTTIGKLFEGHLTCTKMSQICKTLCDTILPGLSSVTAKQELDSNSLLATN